MLYLSVGGCIDATGAAPFVDAPGPYAANLGPAIALYVGGAIGIAPDVTVVTVEDAAGGLDVWVVSPLTSVQNGSIAGAGSLVLLASDPSLFSLGGLGSPPLFPSLTGSFFFLNFTNGPGGCGNFGAGALGDLTLPSSVPPGWAPATVAGSPRKLMAWAGVMSSVLVQHTPNPLNAGLSLTYAVLIDGVLVPGASVTIPADTGSSGAAQFLAGFPSGAQLQVQATPSGPLLASVTDIVVVVE